MPSIGPQWLYRSICIFRSAKSSINHFIGISVFVFVSVSVFVLKVHCSHCASSNRSPQSTNTDAKIPIQSPKSKHKNANTKKCTHRASSGWCRGPQSTGYSNSSRTHLPTSQESGLPPPPPSYVVSQDLQPLLLLLLMISPKDLEKLPSEKIGFWVDAPSGLRTLFFHFLGCCWCCCWGVVSNFLDTFKSTASTQVIFQVGI